MNSYAILPHSAHVASLIFAVDFDYFTTDASCESIQKEAAKFLMKKKQKGKTVERRQDTINPHVTTLINKLADFEWCE